MAKLRRLIGFLLLTGFGTALGQLDSNETYPKKEDIRIERLFHTDVGNRKSIILDQGKFLKLQCVFPAQDWMQIQWVKAHMTSDSQQSMTVIQSIQSPVNGTKIISEVKLESVMKDSSGVYSCISINTGGTVALEFLVTVKEKLFCNETICKNDGICKELVNGYSCRCDPGFIGKHCETTDVCFSNPCLNNGTCISDGDGFTCNCTGEYTGNLCQEQVCIASSCNFAGNCSITEEGSIKCDCQNDRAGDRCQYSCTFNANCYYAYGHGRGQTCVLSGSTERCYCHDYTPDNYCMLNKDIKNECRDSMICNGVGRCYDRKYEYTCSCNRYYYGKNCEFYNECIARRHNCAYGSTCVDLPVGFSCKCPKEQYGDRCQYHKRPCKVECNDLDMTVRCDKRFINTKLRNMRFRTNPGIHQCSLTNNIRRYYRRNMYTFTIGYSGCETEMKIESDYIVYRNSLRAGNVDVLTKSSSKIISRDAGGFKVDLECKIPITETSKKEIATVSLRKNESYHYEDRSNFSLATTIEFFNFKWQSITNFAVGDRLYVKVRFARDPRDSLLSSATIVPVNCYATPSAKQNEPKYALLENGCIKDETFKHENIPQSSSSRAAYFSFESFSFMGESNKISLHCDVRICVNGSTDKSAEKWANCLKSCDLEEEHRPTTPAATVSTNVTAPRRVRREIGLMERFNGGLLEKVVINRNTNKIIYIDQDI